MAKKKNPKKRKNVASLAVRKVRCACCMGLGVKYERLGVPCCGNCSKIPDPQFRAAVEETIRIAKAFEDQAVDPAGEVSDA